MKTITVGELLEQLIDTLRRNPEKINMPVFAFMTDEEGTREYTDNLESPIPIKIVDHDISDRVDLNI